MAKSKKVLTTGEVAKICNVAPRTVSKWFDSGQLKGYRIPGSKDRRIPVDELICFMRTHNMPTDALSASKTRVLVVDGDQVTGAALVSVLSQDSETEIEWVRSSFEAGLVTQRFNPHVLFVNLQSKNIDTSQICHVIRANEEFQAVKLIAVASHLNESECLALMQKGFDDYVTDLADSESLMHKVESAVALIY